MPDASCGDCIQTAGLRQETAHMFRLGTAERNMYETTMIVHVVEHWQVDLSTVGGPR